jgi:hypothetical protein
VSGVSKDEADSGTSWFSRRCEASSGDGAEAPPHQEAFHAPRPIGIKISEGKGAKSPAQKNNFMSRFNPIGTFGD